ncbi:ankyrin repeat domain-containing protein 1-like isoform X2 [Selaginella moellendorffii]|uniref:ankyrin repeat domain-containing protein 1-like isoform X2 n=1 Tax=Selaginella moellendorffii TaxID=88036 RepID=UPI000D1D061C|nr:ankyrin repeat domain-containing protein 1-like isoform X2 [Selaginella moellendorffii]|eukprot:XP_024543840.1 ankyrin repeat domain-containing protein 1-like isoform X2 [Selaginella moellendorffii]
MAEAEVDPFAEKPQPREVWEPAEEENFDEVRESVEGKMDVNIPNPITQNTPLLIAIKNRNVEMAKYLIIRNSDVKMQNAVGDTALHWAALRGDEELVKMIINKMAEINAVGECGNTPLHLACSRNYVQIAKILILARRVPL